MKEKDSEITISAIRAGQVDPEAKAHLPQYYDDSSDEEEIAAQNNRFDLLYNFTKINFKELAKEHGLGKGTEVENSWLLHTIGKMVVFSPEINANYYSHKQRLLLRNKDKKRTHSQNIVKSGLRDAGLLREMRTTLDKISTKESGVGVSNLKELLVFGRLSNRSMKRSYRNAKDKNDRDDHQIPSQIQFFDKSNTSGAEVNEQLVFNSKGLSNSSHPYMDRVNLNLPNNRGDYESAYKGNRHTYGLQATEQVISSSQKAAEEPGRESLKEAAGLIASFKEDIASHFPQNISDAYIAGWIRQICRGEPLFGFDDKMNAKLYSLTYLLFKTETFRSPAALVSNLQMLELIINGKMSFDEAFAKTQMPMSISGAIRAARTLDRIYNELDDNSSFYNFNNPYQYSTYYNEESEKQYKKVLKELVKKESELMEKWLDFKFPNKDSMYLEDIGKEIYATIQSFGLNLHSNALHGMQDGSFGESIRRQQKAWRETISL